MTEADAIRQARQGDAAAFEYLYTSHRKRVYSLCLRMLKNTADAEDLTQQAFLQVFQKIGTFRGESGFSTWLHRVTLNVVLMYLRRKKPAGTLFQDAERPTSGEVSRQFGVDDVSLVGAVDRLNLSRALHQLPSGYRRFFLLHDVIGYKHSEIARILRCSAGCSKSQLHRARRRLRALLQGESWQGQPDAVSA
jgi:RNA polymerase sigma-70 factor (ECF subfamily)